MTTTSKMVLHYLASCYDHILEIGEDKVLEEIKTLGEDALSVYPNLLKKLKGENENEQ